MPFKSEKQRRYLWMKHPEIARRWAKKYGSKPKPKRKKSHASLVLAILILLVSCATSSPEYEVETVSTQKYGVYAMWGENYRPIGERGTMIGYYWSGVNPNRDQYNFSNIHDIISENPWGVQLNIFHHTSDGDFKDWTPGWVGVPSVVLTCGNYRAYVPDYRSATWRSELLKMVAVLGKEFNGDPRVTSVVIAAGLDGETQLVKETHGCNWLKIAGQQASGLEYRWGQFLPVLMRAYKDAFPDKLVLLNNAPGSGRMQRADTAVAMGIGLKHAGMIPDLNYWEGDDDALWAPMAKYCMSGVPCWVESAYGFGNAEHDKWSAYAGLSYHPVGMDVHKTWFTVVDAEFIAWMESFVGVSLQDTPGVWTVLRDSEYPILTNASGHIGNWNFWMTVLGGDRVLRKDMPVAVDDWRSRQCRWGTSFVAIPDDGFRRSAYRMEVTYLDYGTEEMSTPYTSLTRTNSGEWRVWITYPPAEYRPIEITLKGGGYLHSIMLYGAGAPTPTPTVTPTSIPTAVPTATYTPVPTVVPVPTLIPTPSIEDDMAALADRWERERGTRLRFMIDVY